MIVLRQNYKSRPDGVNFGWSRVFGPLAAVHLTVLGYLATAGRALPVLDQFTVLAGWEPSETWWLSDVLQRATEPSTWRASESGTLAAQHLARPGSKPSSAVPGGLSLWQPR